MWDKLIYFTHKWMCVTVLWDVMGLASIVTSDISSLSHPHPVSPLCMRSFVVLFDHLCLWNTRGSLSFPVYLCLCAATVSVRLQGFPVPRNVLAGAGQHGVYLPAGSLGRAIMILQIICLCHAFYSLHRPACARRPFSREGVQANSCF